MKDNKKIHNLQIGNIPKQTSIQKEPIIEGELTGYPSIDKPWLKYYSEDAKNASMPEMTIYEFLVDRNYKFKDRTALNYFNRKISYGELINNIDDTARALINIGVKQNDIVTILMPTLPETIYLFYALSKIGAVANMVDPRTNSSNIYDYIKETNSKYVFVVDVAASKIKDIDGIKPILVSPSESLPAPLKLGYNAKEFVESMKNKNKGNKLTDAISWKQFISYKNANRLSDSIYPKYSKDRPLVIVHTGGTTGKPKGVVLSNYNVNSASYQCELAGFDFKREHTWLNIMPPFIAYGIGNGLHLPLTCGMEVILIPKFDPQKFDDLLKKYEPNHMVGVPSHYENIINSRKLAKSDLSYIIAPTVGGDKMDEKLEEQTNEFLLSHNCEYKITKGYGMTEVNAAVAACNSNETNKLGSVGIPFPQTIISIFDPDNGMEMRYGEIGEVCITGPNTMLKYFKNEEETNKILRRHSDGKIWVHSGDLGYITQDGNLFIVDRIKRMIIRHDGFKVFPNLIEDVICKHESIKSCKVIGINDFEHTHGKLPIVFIVLKNNCLTDFEHIKGELIDLCKTHLPEYSQPCQFIVKDYLPLTSIGKVDFVALEEEYKSTFSVEKPVQKIITKRTNN